MCSSKYQKGGFSALFIFVDLYILLFASSVYPPQLSLDSQKVTKCPNSRETKFSSHPTPTFPSQTEIVKVAVLESMIEAAVLARAAVVDTELANLSEVQNHMGAAVSRIIEDVEALQVG